MTTAVIKDDYQSTQVAEDYDRQRFTSLGGKVFDALERRAIRRVVARLGLFPGCTQVLDIPCGTGRITGVLLALGLPVTGGDISEAMLAVARGRWAKYGRWLNLRQMDLDHLDLPTDSFELVTCIRLMHHLDSPARAAVLRELARVSRRYVLVNVSYSSPFYRLRRTFKRSLGQGVSRSSATGTEIDREIAQAGLLPVSRQFILPWISEDLLLLLEKIAPGNAGGRTAIDQEPRT